MWRIAAGYLAMTLRDFEALSPVEFQWRVEQAMERENREFQRLAQLACWVINPWLTPGTQMRADQLFRGRPLPPPDE